MKLNLKNKKVIRKEVKKGEFTTVSNSILHNPNLTINSKMLMIQVLSDSDDKFDFSRTLYMKRLGVTKNTLNKIINELTQQGYMKMTKIGKTHYNHYTFNEFGNMKPKAKGEENDENKTMSASEREKVITYVKPIVQLFENSEMNKIITDLLTEANDGKIIEFYDFKSQCEKLITKVKKKKYKSIIDEMGTKLNSKPKSFQKIYTDYIKSEIFEKNNLEFDYRNRYYHKLSSYNAEKSRYNPDPESAAADRLDGC